MTHPTEPTRWLVDALGASGECAEHIIFARGRVAGLNPRQIRAAARELCIEQYDGARSRMWRLPRESGPPSNVSEPNQRPSYRDGGLSS
jgi:hypothetical protein